ncbi:MAG: transketolase C-terminal domain-containing protein [Eubacterium sp.]|nr:transketolase C-terminal domain-containing protein [Eubacterium sp.]
MQFDKRTARKLSMLGSRGACAKGLEEILDEDDRAVILAADVIRFSGLEAAQETHPDRVINVGIAEQNMIGIAAGLAKDGWHVYATTYANFLVMRAFEQVRINVGYMGFPIRLIGSCGGVGMGNLGYTHFAVEDIALMRTIPGMTILSPADGWETYKATKALKDYDKPTYLRLSGEMNMPIVYREDYDYQIGKNVCLREGKDVVIFATGSMVATALEVAERLEKDLIQTAVMDIHTISPLDEEFVRKSICGRSLCVTIEEHSLINGVGDKLFGVLGHGTESKFIQIGFSNDVKKADTQNAVLQKCGMGTEAICSRILCEIREDTE